LTASICVPRMHEQPAKVSSSVICYWRGGRCRSPASVTIRRKKEGAKEDAQLQTQRSRCNDGRAERRDVVMGPHGPFQAARSEIRLWAVTMRSVRRDD